MGESLSSNEDDSDASDEDESQKENSEDSVESNKIFDDKKHYNNPNQDE